MKKFIALSYYDRHNIILKEIQTLPPISIDDLANHLNRKGMMSSSSDVGRTVLNILKDGYIIISSDVYGHKKYSVSSSGREFILKGGYKKNRSIRFWLNEIWFHLGNLPKMVITFFKKGWNLVWLILGFIATIATIISVPQEKIDSILKFFKNIISFF